MNWGSSLRARIGILLCAAALPAAAISIASAISLYGTTVALNNEALLDAARSASRRVEDEITEALKIARLLAAFPNIGPAGAVCDEAFAAVVKTSAVISSAALIDPTGRLVCSAGVNVDSEKALLLAASAEIGRLTVSGTLGASSVALIGRPEWRLAVARPLLSPFKAAMDTSSSKPRIGIFDGSWHAIAGSRAGLQPPTEERAGDNLPVPPSKLVNTVTAYSQDGVTYRRAVVPVEWSNLYAVAFQAEPELLAEETAVFASAILAPLLTIAFTIAAAWFGIDRLVLRWISYLRRLTDAYAGGRQSVRASRLEQAPDELAALGAAFDRMADAVGERTAAAEAEARARGLLLLELHHRINNNFQLVSSLISLQKREASPEAAEALSAHERRVNAMATAFRVSYHAGEVQPVRLRELLCELSDSIRAGPAASPPRLEIDAPESLPAIMLDRAVPAALLVTELCAGRQPRSVDDYRPTKVKARAANGEVTISISGPSAPCRLNGLDMRLRGLFATQLNARVEQDSDGSQIRIVFPLDREPPHTDA